MISNEATRKTHISQACIDQVITQKFECNVIVLKQQSFSDHEALLVTWNAHTTEANFSFYRDFSFLKKAEIFERYPQMLSQELSDASEDMKNSDCVNTASDLFQKCFLKLTIDFAYYREKKLGLQNYRSGIIIESKT